MPFYPRLKSTEGNSGNTDSQISLPLYFQSRTIIKSLTSTSSLVSRKHRRLSFDLDTFTLISLYLLFVSVSYSLLKVTP